MSQATSHDDMDDGWGPYAATIGGVFIGLAILLGGQVAGYTEEAILVGGLIALGAIGGLTYLVHADI